MQFQSLLCPSLAYIWTSQLTPLHLIILISKMRITALSVLLTINTILKNYDSFLRLQKPNGTPPISNSVSLLFSSKRKKKRRMTLSVVLVVILMVIMYKAPGMQHVSDKRPFPSPPIFHFTNGQIPLEMLPVQISTVLL